MGRRTETEVRRTDPAAPPGWQEQDAAGPFRGRSFDGETRNPTTVGPAAGATAQRLGGRRLLLWSVALAVLAMPLMAFSLPVGIELSFQSAQHLAIVDGIDFGADAVFTYGPLGFLSFPQLYHPTTSLLALLTHVVVVVSTIALTLRALSRAMAPLAAFGLTYVIFLVSWGELLRIEWLAEAAACVVVLVALRRLVDAVDRHDVADRTDPSVTLDTTGRLDAMALGFGAATSVMGLVKLSSGLQVGSVTASTLMLMCWLQPNPVARIVRTMGLWMLSATISLLTIWVATGQRLAALPDFVSQSRELTSGYSGAMGVEAPGTGIEYLLGAVVVLAIVAIAAARFRSLGPWRAAAFCLPIALYAFSAAKHGFVRHDRHAVVFFITVGLVPLVFLRPGNRAKVAAIALVALVGSMVQGSPPSIAMFDPVAHVEQSVDLARLVVVPAERRDGIDAAREATRDQYALSAVTVARLSGTLVHADPHDTGVLWAYPEFVWGAPPVFQTFGAYTAALDDLNADYLASNLAPDHILRAPKAIDLRYPGFESPRYMIEMACRYRQVALDGAWFVLARDANRCGSSASIAEAPAPFGEQVAVPPADACNGLVTFSIDGLDTTAQHLRSALSKDAR